MMLNKLIVIKLNVKVQFCPSESLNDDSDKDYLECIACLLFQRKLSSSFPASIFLFKVSYRNIKTKYEICSKLTTRTLEQHHCHRSGVFLANLEQTSPCSGDSIADFKEENAD